MVDGPRPLPKMIGRYKVVSLIPGGNMGEVYKAFDPQLHRHVVLKTVAPGAKSQDILDRLYREARACARLQHSGIVTVYGLEEIGGAVYIVMEYLEGESLAAAMVRGDLGFRRKIAILIEILDALEYAHSQGIIHRDVKPSNVHLLPGGKVKLLDFGLAHVARESSLTMTGTVMGTPYYMSPEQMSAAPANVGSDVYSTGVIAYELLTHRRPFDADHFTAVMLKVVQEPPPPMGTFWSESFPELEHIVTRAMEKLPESRYASAAEMRAAFALFLTAWDSAIDVAEVDVARVSQHAAEEARTLLASGRVDEARTLLNDTLRVHPDASEARVVEQTLLKPPSPSADGKEDQPRIQGEPFPLPKPARFSRRSIAAAIAVPLVAGLAMWVATAGTPDPDPGSQPGPGLGPQPGPGLGPQPGPDPGPQPGPDPGPQPGPEPGPQPGSRPGANPGPQPGPRAGGPQGPSSISPRLLYQPANGVAPTAPGIRYRILQVEAEQQQVTEVETARVFQSGERIRFAFQSNIDGHLYVVQQGSSGRWSVLFPHPLINGGLNTITAFQEYMVPPQGAFRFDDTTGTERIMVFLSREAISDLPGFDAPVTAPETIQQARVEQLNALVGRDLLFDAYKRTSGSADKVFALPGTVVVNRAQAAGAVAATFEIEHR